MKISRRFISLAVSGTALLLIAGCSQQPPAQTADSTGAVASPTPAIASPGAKAEGQAPTKSETAANIHKGRSYPDVRGQITALVAPQNADEPAAVTVAHEAIPGFMEAMSMTMPLQNATDIKKLKQGDKISFDLLLGQGLALSNIRILPPGTHLKLAGSQHTNAKTQKSHSAGGHQ